jgi:type I restriction enzyme M protein
MANGNDKSLESWIWDAACSIRGAKDAGKYKDFILPLIFIKRLCDVFDDELNRIAQEVGSRAKAFKLVKHDKKLVRFFLPLEPKNSDDAVWTVIRTLSDKIGEQLTTHLRSIADANPLLKGIIDRVDFNATTHGQRDIDDDRLSNLVEAISAKRLGLTDVEADIIGRSYEYLIRKFAEGSGQSAGEFYTPAEVGLAMARIMDPQPGMDIYDPCCGSAGLLIKCRLVHDEKQRTAGKKNTAPIKLYGQENEPGTWAMANMNMIIHDMEGEIQIGDTFRRPKFRVGNRLQTFDCVVANPMWNQKEFKEKDYDADELNRFPKQAGYPGVYADWGWMQHILASMSNSGRAAVVLGTASGSRGSGEDQNSVEKTVRKYFIDHDLIDAVILLPFNIFYNTDAPGLIYILNKRKTGDRRSRILFINASDGYVKGKPKNFLSLDVSHQIVKAYHEYQELDGFSRVVKTNEIEERDFYLTPSRYVIKRREVRVRDAATVIAELSDSANKMSHRFSEAMGALSVIQFTDPGSGLMDTEFGRILSSCRLVALSEFVQEVSQRAGNTPYPVFSCSKLYGIVLQKEKFKQAIASADQSSYKVVSEGMFAYDPMLLWDGSIGGNFYPFAGVVSPAYTVFTVGGDIEPEFLHFVLRSSLLLPHYISISDGTNMRRRKAKFADFARLRVPYPSKDIRMAISALLKTEGSMEKLKRLTGEAKQVVFHSYVHGQEDV